VWSTQPERALPACSTRCFTGGFGDKLLKLLYDHVLGLLGIG
jgi:hypothetical protein